MSPRGLGPWGRYIVVADEDRTIANVVIDTLTTDGHAVFLAYDGVSALHLALGLKACDLVISNSRVGGKPGIDLIVELRDRLPWVPILYLANPAKSPPDVERRLPRGVEVLREPFTPSDLREAVEPLLTDL